MASSFNLTAEINLRGPANLNRVVSNIRRQLSTVSLNLNINPAASRGIQNITSQVQALSAAIQTANTNVAALSASLANLGSTLSNVNGNIGSLGGGLSNVSNQVNTVRNNTQQAAAGMEEFGRQSALAVRRFAAFSVATGGIYALVRAISEGYREFLSFNQELVRLQQVTGASANGLKGLASEITRLASGLGVSSSELLTVSSTLAQAGLTATQTKTALEALAKSALAPSFDNLNDTVEGSIALMRQFGISAGELEGSLGSINAVAAAFAVESGDIIKAIQRTGGVFAAASRGISEGKDSLNEFIALFTSVRATTRESAETIATGLRTIFTRIQRGGTIEALKEYGVELTDLEGKFVGPFEAIKRLSAGLQSLDPRDLRFSEIVEELGGFRQIGKVIPLIQQFATAQQALGVAQRGSGSLADDAATAQLALANKITKVREEFLALIRDIGESKSFQKFADLSLQLASALISVASAAKEVLPALTALAAIKAIPAVSQFIGGFGRGISRRNSGGPIRHFARGGYVPGSGNRDTVPAMLTPGEFVIRKKAVETIGLSNLQEMNQYTTGGFVKKFARGGSTAGIRKGARSRFKELTEEEIAKLSTNDLIKYAKAQARDIFSSGGAGMVTGMKFVEVPDKKITPELESSLQTYLGKKGFWQEQISPFGRQSKSSTKSQEKLSRADALKKQESRMADEVAARAQQWTKIRSGSSIDNYLSSTLKDPILSDYRTVRSGGSLSKDFHNTRLRQAVNKALEKYDDFDYSAANIDKFTSAFAAKKFAAGGSVRGLTLDKAKSAILGKQLSGADMIKAAKKAGYDIEELDNGLVQLSRNNKIMHTLSRMDASSLLGSMMTGYNFGGLVQKFKDGGEVNDPILSNLIARLKAIGGPAKAKEIAAQAGVSFSGIPSMAFKQSSLKAGKVSKENVSRLVSLVSAVEQFSQSSTVAALAESKVPIEKRVQGLSLRGPNPKQTSTSRTIRGKKIGVTRKVAPQGLADRFEALVTARSKSMIAELSDLLDAEMSAKGIKSGLTKSKRNQMLETAMKTNVGNLIGDIFERALIATGAEIGPVGKGDRRPIDLARLGPVAQLFDLDPNQPTEVKRSMKKLSLGKKGLSGQIARFLKLQGFAEGGSAQDTVPALLTPGEFVINKKAAKRIGMAKLNKLNKADKIKGFNKGGAVGGIQSFAAGGDVQRFFVGGIVDGFSKLTRAISSMLSAVTGFNRTTTTVTRNLAAQQVATFRQQGLSGSALKNAMVNAGYGPGGVNNMRTRNQMAQNATTRANQQQTAGQGGMGASALVWIGPLIAESINSAISSRFGQTGAMAGSAITSTISGATIGSAFGPQVAIAGAVAGLAAGLLKLTDVARDYETAEKEKTIEAKAKILEKSFEKLAKETDKVKIAGLQESIIDNVRSVIGAERGVARNVTESATPGSVSRFFGSTIDTTSLSKDLAQAGKTGGESAKAFIVDALSKGQDFDAVFKSLSKGSVTAQKQIQEAIAIAQEGTALTELRAKATEARESGNIPQANELMKQYDARVAEINQEFRKAAIEQQNAQKNLNAVTIAVNTFAVAIKNLDNVINRSSAEFAEAQRLMDIEIGSFFGDQAKIMGPSRLNENVLENPAAYSAQEITKAIQNLGQNLQFSPEFTKELETATQSKSILESELPNILAEAAAAQKAGRFDEASQENLLTKLEDLFKTVPGMGAGEAVGAAGNLFEEIKSKLSERQDISLEELSNNSAALNKILQGYNSTIDVAAKAQKSYNDVLNEVNGALNRYVSALEQTTDAQIQAATVRTEGRNRLAETLGQGVSLTSLNQPFEDMIRSLTSSIGANGRPMAGTGTTDADTIARRLELSQKRFADLQKQNRPAAGTPAFDKYNKDLANAALSVRNLSKAQERLATDTTKASNALNKIQELRQAQESRRGTFNDVLKNINNPEWIMNFTREVGALQKVQGGRGNLNDIPLALEALPKRLAGIADPGAREAEQQKFYDNIANILKNSGFDKGAVDQAMKLIGAQGPDNEMQAAIDQYNAAINNQAKAIENSANQTQTAANDFYAKIIQSANDFAARVGAAGVVPGGAAPLARGGMVYASKGKLINFEPKGTDTVPAMLTPGEFVINKRATQKNLPLLKAINNGDKGYKNGGIVYAAGGGEIGKRTLDSMTGSFDSFKYYDSSGKKIPQSEFERIAYRIDAGLIEITKRARETANIYDDNVIKDFGREISDLVLFGRSRSDEVAKMDPKKLYKFRVPFQRSFNILKQKLINPSPPPQYLLDDILPPVAKPETIAKNPATQAKVEPFPVAIGGGGFRELPNLTSTPKYYDELTYKEWLDDLIGISWAKFDMGKYDQMTGPIPPDKKRFISPAIYYNKDAELTVDQKDKQQKAKQQIQTWEQEFNNWKTSILKRRQEFEIANIPYRPAKNEEYFDNFNKWVEYYTGKNAQEVEKIFATANYKPSFPARETLYDTRFTGGTVGDPRRKEDIPNNLPQNDILRVATALKAEIDNTNKEYQSYLAQANSPNPNVELRDSSLKIAEQSYVDSIGLLKEMSSKTNLFRNGLQTFETGAGKNLQIGAAINQLGQLRDKLRGGGALGRLQYNEVDDSIIDTYFANRAQIVEQNAPTVLKDPNKPELGTNLVDRPVTIKEVFDLSDEEKKSVRGIRGVSDQYQSALAYFKIKRGEYNRKLILAQRRMQYNQQKKQREEQYKQGKIDRAEAAGLSSGGVVYASQGKLINFQPRGTDTVPAMLTPGEFVVNKKATKANMGLLKAINSKKYNTGGLVTKPQYLANGGDVRSGGSSAGGGVLSIDTSKLDSSFSTFNSSVSDFSGAINSFSSIGSSIVNGLSGLDSIVSAFTSLATVSKLLGGTASGLGSTISSFNTAVTRLDAALSKIPDNISLNVNGSIPVNVTVTVNGGEGLDDKLQTFKDQIYNEISAGITSATNGRLRINLNTSKK